MDLFEKLNLFGNSKYERYKKIIQSLIGKTITKIERTLKSKDKFKLKLNNLRSYLLQNIHILWLVPDESMKKFVDKQIKAYNWKLEKQHIEIFNYS